ncbi:transporter [Mesorhizobium sp. L-8-10]|uniref:bile acid:sodium symporter family protein n=1 Tax=unclassified Mesorhizobium TaxID=325217 RepID=UPI0019277B57|nr:MULTISPECIES: bile acid:sodium symporter family protein [unclassified Mesorhizobium]BCH22217.1 transporter [Mesorhizobium sp. L-8-3]BCH30031.1 transporter [Mesorhizobium sp. L-8-10]
MQSSAVFSIFLPAALAVIMLGLGLSLTVEDFRKVLSRPKPVVVALVCQALILPVICFGIVYLSALPPAIAVGMMLLAASPGGSSANLYSHLAGGDVALNITLTAINSVLAMITLPIIVNFSLLQFYGEGKVIPLQFDRILQIFALVLVPVASGMFLRNRYPTLALGLERPVKVLSAVFLAAIVLVALIREWQTLVTWGPVIGMATLAFNLISLAIGYGVPRLFNLGYKQAIAICMEIGIHNSTLVIAIAMSPLLLNNSEMAIPPAIYGLVAYITAAIFVALAKRRAGAAAV